MTKPNRETPAVKGLRCINYDQRLYVIPSGGGFSCLGFDVAHKRTAQYAAWLKAPELAPPARKGTVKAWKAYNAALSEVLRVCTAYNMRCPVELTPELMGLEGKRVEVIRPNGDRRRFKVGRSTGPIPIHLEIANSRSLGGGGAMIFPGDRIVIVG